MGCALMTPTPIRGCPGDVVWDRRISVVLSTDGDRALVHCGRDRTSLPRLRGQTLPSTPHPPSWVAPRRDLRRPRSPRACASARSIDGVVYQVLSHPLDTPGPRTHLTSAERGIGERILAGWSQLAIARARGTSPRTVATIELLYRKVGVQSRAELMARAEVVLGVEDDVSS